MTENDYSKYRNTRFDPAIKDLAQKYGLVDDYNRAVRDILAIRGMDRSNVEQGLTKMKDVTYLHCLSVANSMFQTMQREGYSEKDCVIGYLTGMVHDIGKVDVPPEILNKPGKFENNEREIMDMHARYSIEHTKDYDNPWIRMGAQHHHIKPSAYRYPSLWYSTGNLSKQDKEFKLSQVPEFIKLINICDSYDGLIQERQYKKGFSLAKTFGILEGSCAASLDLIQNFERTQLKNALNHGISFNINSLEDIKVNEEVSPKLAVKAYETIIKISEKDPIRTKFTGTLAITDGMEPSLIISDKTGPLFIIGGEDRLQDVKNNIPKYEKDKYGNFHLDKNGNKIPLYEKDENGNIIYNDKGDKTLDYQRDEHGFIKQELKKDSFGIKLQNEINTIKTFWLVDENTLEPTEQTVNNGHLFKDVLPPEEVPKMSNKDVEDISDILDDY